MKTKRTPISKRVRFEIFKRDSFKCQYCGRQAPDIVLHIDHIKPVVSGGEPDITNLITSCLDCNLGKGPRQISDQSAVKKAKAQLDSLQERKEQLEMMVDWQRGLLNLDEQAVDHASSIWSQIVPPFHLTESGRDALRKHLKTFGLPEVVKAMRTSASEYLRRCADGSFSPESVEQAWQKVPGVCYVSRQIKDRPYLKDLYSIRSTLSHRFRGYFQPNQALSMMETAVTWGVSTDTLRANLARVRNWTQFRGAVSALIAEHRQSQGDQ